MTNSRDEYRDAERNWRRKKQESDKDPGNTDKRRIKDNASFEADKAFLRFLKKKGN